MPKWGLCLLFTKGETRSIHSCHHILSVIYKLPKEVQRIQLPKLCYNSDLITLPKKTPGPAAGRVNHHMYPVANRSETLQLANLLVLLEGLQWMLDLFNADTVNAFPATLDLGLIPVQIVAYH